MYWQTFCIDKTGKKTKNNMGKKKHNKIDEDQVDDTILDEEIDKALSEEEEQNEEQVYLSSPCRY